MDSRAQDFAIYLSTLSTRRARSALLDFEIVLREEFSARDRRDLPDVVSGMLRLLASRLGMELVEPEDEYE